MKICRVSFVGHSIEKSEWSASPLTFKTGHSPLNLPKPDAVGFARRFRLGGRPAWLPCATARQPAILSPVSLLPPPPPPSLARASADTAFAPRQGHHEHLPEGSSSCAPHARRLPSPPHTVLPRAPHGARLLPEHNPSELPPSCRAAPLSRPVHLQGFGPKLALPFSLTHPQFSPFFLLATQSREKSRRRWFPAAPLHLPSIPRRRCRR